MEGMLESVLQCPPLPNNVHAMPVDSSTIHYILFLCQVYFICKSAGLLIVPELFKSLRLRCS
jgi:hypothetical protein